MSALKRRPVQALIAVVGVLLALSVWWFALRPATPDEVASMTARALTKGDVDTLLRLTLPEEREKLHLTSTNVRAFLTETLYAHGLPGPLTVKRVQDYPIDQLQYEFSPMDGNMRGARYPLSIMITQRPNGRWYLPLGYLLLESSAISKEAQNVMDIHRDFWKLADRFGILGIRLNTSGYAMRGTPPK